MWDFYFDYTNRFIASWRSQPRIRRITRITLIDCLRNFEASYLNEHLRKLVVASVSSIPPIARITRIYLPENLSSLPFRGRRITSHHSCLGAGAGGSDLNPQRQHNTSTCFFQLGVSICLVAEAVWKIHILIYLVRIGEVKEYAFVPIA